MPSFPEPSPDGSGKTVSPSFRTHLNPFSGCEAFQIAEFAR